MKQGATEAGQRTEVLNPSADLPGAEEFLRRVEAHFAAEGRTIYKARNEVKVIGAFNVKRFGVPGLLNCLVYSFLREPKAVRAYRHALRLIELGIPTPVPAGYVLHKRRGLLRESYLVTAQSPLGRTMYEFGHVPQREDRREALRAFGRFTARLHEKGVLHLDYSPGNILFDRKEEGDYAFALVDVNRLRFSSEPVSLEEGCRNMCRLWGDEEALREIALAYAEARRADPEMVYERLRRAHDAFWRKRDTRWVHTPWQER